MGPLDTLEKLINEHGSAAILKERIDLAKDQYAALERKLSEAEGKIRELLSESQNHELQNFKLKDRVRDLEKMLESKKGARLEKVQECILILLSTDDEFREDSLLNRIGGNPQIALFHLNELRSAKLAHCSYFIGSPNEWKVSQEGRRYLIQNGIIE